MEKGCVYFFRHIGLSPVKIGYTNNESPIHRFEQFKTYAPYGAELLGFIITDDPNDLEKILHSRFSYARLKGEWFEISKEDVEKIVSFYSNIEDVKNKNDFEISYAKFIANKNKKIEKIEDLNERFISFFQKYSFDKKEGYNEVVFQSKEITEILNTSSINVKNFMNKNNIKYQTHRVNGLIKRGYKLFFNEL